MPIEKKERKQTNAIQAKTDSLWRKPIILNPSESDDPLANLYRGKEAREAAGETAATRDAQILKVEEKTDLVKKSEKTSGAAESVAPEEVKKTPEKATTEADSKPKAGKSPISPRMTEIELKDILRIKSEFFHFTDLREILRGKSLDIYAYLRFLSGDEEVCKIKHLDLMKKLDISRPTLFKQGEWLMRLSLIEKRNVPGDHLGTSYTVRRLEDVLPISENLVSQLDLRIEGFR